MNEEIIEEKKEQVNENVNANMVVTKKKGRHTIVIVLLVVAILGIGFLVFKKLTADKTPDYVAVPAVNITHVRKSSISKEVSLIGSILPSDTYTVSAKVGGEITKVYVKNGDSIKKGDPICEIDASKEIDAAYIQYNTTKKSYDRMQKLYKSGDISLQNFETVKAQYDAAKLAYDTKVEYATPVALGDGIVENADMTVNASISSGDELCCITSEEAKEINFGVTERVLAGISLHDKVTIEKNGIKYDGYITDIGKLINSSGLFNVKATIASVNNFASGVMAKVSFVYEKKNNVFTLPNELVYYENGSAFVYTVGEDNVITKKYIEVGLENEEICEIISGIDKSTNIVATWTSDLAEGTTVNINKVEEVVDEVEVR